MKNFSILLVLFLSSKIGAAQQSQDSLVSQATFLQGVSTQDVEEQIRRLQKTTEILENQLGQDFFTLDNNSTDIGNVPAPQFTEDSKVMEIKKNLDLLRKVIQEKKQRQRDNTKQPADEGMSASSTIQMDEANMDEANSQNTMNQIQVPKKVTDKIVNAFELAGSLFLAGNIEQAIQYYQIVPVESLTAYERNWLDFMLANCHLQLDQYDKAEALFRSVAGFQDSIRISSSAKQSLEYVQSRKRIAELVDEYTRKADAVLQSASNLMGDTEDGT